MVVDGTRGPVPLRHMLALQLHQEHRCHGGRGRQPLVDPNAEPILRDLVIVGTGEPIEDGLAYLGTWQAPGWRDNSFVFHVFERQ